MSAALPVHGGRPQSGQPVPAVSAASPPVGDEPNDRQDHPAGNGRTGRSTKAPRSPLTTWHSANQSNTSARRPGNEFLAFNSGIFPPSRLVSRPTGAERSALTTVYRPLFLVVPAKQDHQIFDHLLRPPEPPRVSGGSGPACRAGEPLVEIEALWTPSAGSIPNTGPHPSTAGR